MDATLLSTVSGFLPVLAAVCGMIICYITLEGWLLLQRRKRRRSPLVRGLLRSPGESLRRQVDDCILDMFGFFFLAVFSPFLVYSVHISQSYFGGSPETLGRTCVSLLLAGGITVYALVKIVICFSRIQRLRLGLECELSVGQELNNLQAQGYRVFNDFPADKFNIDHVVIGKNGVFAVETKGRSKPMRGKGNEDARVILSEDGLTFPTWTENKPLEQARRQARWLQKWLTSAVGEEVYVIPSLALPGWYVELRTRLGILVY